jgi:hypothetical protein
LLTLFIWHLTIVSSKLVTWLKIIHGIPMDFAQGGQLQQPPGVVGFATRDSPVDFAHCGCGGRTYNYIQAVDSGIGGYEYLVPPHHPFHYNTVEHHKCVSPGLSGILRHERPTLYFSAGTDWVQ